MMNLKGAAINWKTSLAGLLWLSVYAAQMAGILIPGVHLDPSGLPLALALLFAKDSTVTGTPAAK